MTEENNTQQGGSGEKTYSAKEYEALREKADNAIAKMVDLEKRTERWASFGDPDAVKAKLEDYDSMRKDKAVTDKKEVEKLLQEAHDAWKGKISEKEQVINELTKQVRTYKIMDPAKSIAGELFVKGSVPFIVQHIESIADLEGDQVVVKGSDGKPARSSEDPSKPMTIREYLGKMAKENPDIAVAKGTGGAGNSGTTTSGATGGITAEQMASMSREERDRLPENVRKALAPQVLKLLSKK